MRHCHRVVLFYSAIAGIIKYRLGLCISRRGGGGRVRWLLCSAESGDQFHWGELITNLLLPYCLLSCIRLYTVAKYINFSYSIKRVFVSMYV